MNLLWTGITILLIILLLIAGALLDIVTGLKVRHPKLPERKAVSGQNRLLYFTQGRELFHDMLREISEAKDHIHLSFFIFEADNVGRQWLDLLKKKAAEGVEVRLLVDFLAAFKLRSKKAELARAGVQLAFSGKVGFPFTVYALNRRNHRKIGVIDGRVGYFGGFNVSRDYLGQTPEKGPWHDNHLKVVGESVAELQRRFLEDWRRSGGSVADRRAFFPKHEKGPSKLVLIATDGKQIETIFAEKLAAARESIIIGSPYFIPSRKLMDVLMDRLEHGVKLMILLPMKRDHALVRPASFHYLQPLIEKGAGLFHFYQGFFHSKAFVVDRKLAYIGTTNFDQRSFFLNDELSGFTDDPVIVRNVLDQLQREIRNFSVEVDAAKVRNRSPIEKLKTICSAWFSFFL
ncbi:phosphatidylserine/phosphatidylglycerophosphate/cardiolipin synthase family protein [Sporolactobacillus sp. THM19-2]|uniref:phospholipase D-like domain-containing protein n=1 Tax=Sporolactobacillus sp. THM19-2 TaxID=2511171 RepID=UPI0010224928|nr:phospholipase D-like domain-containing protein [Sporolactobacillus sp. THM19-2]RYL94021.1 phospholipase [Sporolactobacillus sp. THM19-2]